MESIAKLFDFNKVEDTREGIGLYLRFQRQSKEVKESFAAFVHRVGRRIQKDPDNGWPKYPLQARDAFKKEMEEAINYYLSPEAGDLQAKPSELRLTGPTGLAQAYRTVADAIKLGFDLDEPDYDTVSKCKKAVSEENSKKAANEESAQRRAELSLKLQEEGLTPGTAEFEQELSSRMLSLASSSSGKKGKKDEAAEKAKDEWDAFAESIATRLRELSEVNPEEAHRIQKSLGTQLDNMFKQCWDKLQRVLKTA